MKICATIILYNPSDDIFLNIDTFYDDVDLLIVVDNSDKEKDITIVDRLLSMEKVLYIDNQENLGIAKALNIACNKAINLGYDWILTMDQDSRFVDFSKYIDCFKKNVNENIGIYTLNHTTHRDDKIFGKNKTCIYLEKEIVITSGCIIDLDLYKKIEGFDDKLFIDMVDYDYSHKVILAEKKIILFVEQYLIHSIGELYERKNLLTGKIRKKIEHSPLRIYYATRNRLYLSKKYRKNFQKEYGFFKTLNLLFVHEIIKIILYEKDKFKKIYAKMVALYHFTINKLGKYEFEKRDID